ncbi:unnamed protein product [Dimorphilus gyrociliatus]|uniref:G-protein coupled receptors family 1 profile domain-containing protein n=1 Tax=Dimorphilus gyrociliatus TaxID=2664684 RepID=A0A7I8VXR1_9ANNE|nr:unnamed protein product [Dimorphilus gyrociliatus]
MEPNKSIDFTDKPTFTKFNQILHIYYLPFVIGFGIFGNILSIFIFLLTSLRNYSSSVYLIALAFSDILFLVVLILSWLQWISINPVSNVVACRIFSYVSHVSAALSVWFVLAVTVERYIAVFIPLHKNVWCTTKRASKVVLCIIIFALLAYLIQPIATSVQRRYLTNSSTNFTLTCEPLFDWRYSLTIFANVDTFFTFIAPCLIILLANIRMSMRIWESVKARQDLTGETVQIPESRITIVLSIISMAFVLLNAPAHCFKAKAIIDVVVKGNSSQTQLILDLQTLANIIYYSSHSINFVLYFFCGTTFRQNLIKFCKEWRKNVSVTSQRTTVSTRARTVEGEIEAELQLL